MTSCGGLTALIGSVVAGGRGGKNRYDTRI